MGVHVYGLPVCKTKNLIKLKKKFNEGMSKILLLMMYLVMVVSQVVGCRIYPSIHLHVQRKRGKICLKLTIKTSEQRY